MMSTWEDLIKPTLKLNGVKLGKISIGEPEGDIKELWNEPVGYKIVDFPETKEIGYFMPSYESKNFNKNTGNKEQEETNKDGK